MPAATPDPVLSVGFEPKAAHRRRLRELWRSAGWPHQDPLEAELLAAGLLTRVRDDRGHETLRLTDAGVALLADTRQRHRAARDAHEALVERVAREMQRAGRVVWRGLSLRARVGGDGVGEGEAPAAAASAAAAASGSAADGVDPLPGELARWVLAMPDVYSIRHTTVEAYLAPIAHEVKVRRADLLADLRRPAKGEAYRWLAGECWYVIREGIAEPDEIPPVYGVLVAPERGPLVVARAAPQRPMRLPFAVWMALARATPEPPEEGAQGLLGAPDAVERRDASSVAPLAGASDPPGAPDRSVLPPGEATAARQSSSG